MGCAHRNLDEPKAELEACLQAMLRRGLDSWNINLSKSKQKHKNHYDYPLIYPYAMKGFKPRFMLDLSLDSSEAPPIKASFRFYAGFIIRFMRDLNPS